MLSTPAPYPHPGAPAFLRPAEPGAKAQPCRIIQSLPDGRKLISLTGRDFAANHPDQRARASGNRTVALADLAETEAECSAPPAKPRRKRSPRKAQR